MFNLFKFSNIGKKSLLNFLKNGFLLRLFCLVNFVNMVVDVGKIGGEIFFR